MSILQALEVLLATVTPALPTASENVVYTPQSGVPYQRADLLPAPTTNPTLGDTMYRETGIFQVMLCYPASSGSGDARAQADVLRNFFFRGQSCASGSTTVQIDSTPSIGSGNIVGDRYCLPVRVKYFANLFAGK